MEGTSSIVCQAGKDATQHEDLRPQGCGGGPQMDDEDPPGKPTKRGSLKSAMTASDVSASSSEQAATSLAYSEAMQNGVEALQSNLLGTEGTVKDEQGQPRGHLQGNARESSTVEEQKLGALWTAEEDVVAADSAAQAAEEELSATKL